MGAFEAAVELGLAADQVRRCRESFQVFAGEQGSRALGKRERLVGVGPCVRLILRAAALDIVKQYVIGPMFTPPSIKGPGPNDTKGTIQLPGSVGGADWQGGAFDPDTGFLYVQSITGPFVADIIPGDPAKTNLRFTRGTREYPPAPLGLPLLKPPYGTIAAIDLTKGAVAWEIPNGDTPENVKNHPALSGLALGRTGRAGQPPGALATKSLLIVAEPGYGPTPDGKPGSMLRAYDKRTGRELAALQLPAPQSGSPMTYMLDGRQFLVIAVSSNDHPGELIAYALPQARPPPAAGAE